MALLELNKVEKHFGGLTAVNKVTMQANDGEILAIVGPNGAGKSTLLKLVVGLETPSGGKVTFDGQDITGYPTHRVRQMGIAMVQQTPRIFPSMTILENATLGALFGQAGAHRNEEQAIELASEALSYVGLADRRYQSVGTLNLQERRFLEMARAVAGQPRILALDEVMAGLNDGELETSINVVRTLRDQFKMTIIWVEHVMKAVMSLAERAIVINFGEVLTRGLPQDVLRDPAVVEAYLGQEIHHA